ncbi:MAG: methyltransferase domain-containing protein, partial [Holophagales bacterium]|nr:methyltransferase domain-containing protein [Holophagales bacterium]
KGLIEDLPVADGSVDWVISNCVINLSPEKPAVFREIARVLAPGGRFSISDIVAEELPDVIRDQAIAYAACVGGAISEARYLAGLEAAGLTELEVTERQVYGESQLRGIVASDLADFGLTESSPEAAELLGQVEKVAGKVWSAKITGRKPA